jgi:copper(I)-binding protein
MNAMRMIFAAVLTLAVAGAAQAHAVKTGALTLSDLQVRATPAGVPTSAAYLTIANAGKAADRLMSIDCACADAAMMHETEIKGGISSMSMVDSVIIPAGGKIAFSPGGLHVMLVGVKGPLKAGRTQQMTLRFEKAGTVKAGFDVVDVIAR